MMLALTNIQTLVVLSTTSTCDPACENCDFGLTEIEDDQPGNVLGCPIGWTCSGSDTSVSLSNTNSTTYAMDGNPSFPKFATFKGSGSLTKTLQDLKPGTEYLISFESDTPGLTATISGETLLMPSVHYVKSAKSCDFDERITIFSECQRAANAKNLDLVFGGIAGPEWASGCLYHNGKVYYSPHKEGSNDVATDEYICQKEINRNSFTSHSIHYFATNGELSVAFAHVQEYDYVHDGHCAGASAWIKNVDAEDEASCASICSSVEDCKYFAFNGNTCAQYRICEDDDNYPTYNAYRLISAAAVRISGFGVTGQGCDQQKCGPPEAIQYVHDGHCAAGHISNVPKDSLEDCGKVCLATNNCGYIAYDSTTCAMYTLAGGCPDDDNHPSYNAYFVQPPNPSLTYNCECTGRFHYNGFRMVRGGKLMNQDHKCVDLFALEMKLDHLIKALNSIGHNEPLDYDKVTAPSIRAREGTVEIKIQSGRHVTVNDSPVVTAASLSAALSHVNSD